MAAVGATYDARMVAPSDMPRWLITGATGFLGSNAARFLESRAYRIAASREGAPTSGFDSAVTLDLSDMASIEMAVRAASPDVILHTAALADHEACERDPEYAAVINVEATGALADAATSVGARLVHISTDAVFDGRRGHYREDDAPSPFSVYGRTKLAGEQAALAGTDALVIRTNFFGWSPSRRRSILEFFVNSLEAGAAVQGYTDFVVTSLYAQDLMQALWELHDRAGIGVLHLGARDALSKYEFGCLVAAAFGLNPDLISPVSAAAGQHSTSRVLDLSLDSSRAAALLGRELPSQGEGIARAVHERPA